MDNLRLQVALNKQTMYDIKRFDDGLPPSYVISESDPILKTIFACNPVTGKPSCDLGLVFNNNTSREVQDYVRQQLAVANDGIKSVSQNPDDALAVVKSQFETTDKYVNRIRDYIYKLNNVE